MKDFATGGAIAALGLLFMVVTNAIHPVLPYVLFGLFLVGAYIKFLQTLVQMIKRGETPNVTFFNGF